MTITLNGERIVRVLLATSALLLGAMLLATLGRASTPAYANVMDLVASNGDFIMLTAEGGADDVLVVLDQRSESLLVYRMQNQQRLAFQGRQPLKDLFFAARQGHGGAPLVPNPADDAPRAPNTPR